MPSPRARHRALTKARSPTRTLCHQYVRSLVANADGRRRPGHDLGEALRVRVEAALDRDRVKGRMATDELGDDVGAAAAGAADEDEGRGICHEAGLESTVEFVGR